MDLAGEGVNMSNIWSGPDMPFAGSLIMMAVDVVLYGWIAFYLDSVMPSRYSVKLELLLYNCDTCFKVNMVLKDHHFSASTLYFGAEVNQLIK